MTAPKACQISLLPSEIGINCYSCFTFKFLLPILYFRELVLVLGGGHLLIKQQGKPKQAQMVKSDQKNFHHYRMIFFQTIIC
jgi:hypothetical protein